MYQFNLQISKHITWKILYFLLHFLKKINILLLIIYIFFIYLGRLTYFITCLPVFGSQIIIFPFLQADAKKQLSGDHVVTSTQFLCSEKKKHFKNLFIVKTSLACVHNFSLHIGYQSLVLSLTVQICLTMDFWGTEQQSFYKFSKQKRLTFIYFYISFYINWVNHWIRKFKYILFSKTKYFRSSALWYFTIHFFLLQILTWTLKK